MLKTFLEEKSFCGRKKQQPLKSFQYLSEVWEVLRICNYKRTRHKRALPEYYKSISGKRQQAFFFLSVLLMKKCSPITLIIHSWSSHNLIHLNKQLQFMLSLICDVILPTCFIHANKFCSTTLTQKWINWILPCTSKQLWANLFLITCLHLFLQKAPTLYFRTKILFKWFCTWTVF